MGSLCEGVCPSLTAPACPEEQQELCLGTAAGAGGVGASCPLCSAGGFMEQGLRGLAFTFHTFQIISDCSSLAD